MKYYFILPFLIALNACVPSKKVVSSSEGAINASAPYLWSDRAFPKTLKVSSSFSNNEKTNITDMANAWQTSLWNTDFFDFDVDTAEITNVNFNLDDLYDNVMAIYKTTRWPNQLPGSALAVTQIYGRRHNAGSSNEFVRIVHADILVNYHIHLFDTINVPSNYDLRTVILHELGHFLGLQHEEYDSNPALSVMYPAINAGETKRSPLPIDIAKLAAKYNVINGFGGFGITSGPSRTYKERPGDPGEEVKILLELHTSGECIHKMNGAVIGRHPASLK